MRKFIFFIVFWLIGLSQINAEDFIRGINYDPVHSVAFAHGVGTDNADLMQKAIFDDLDKLKELSDRYGFKITHIKTFFSEYQSLNNKAKVNIADVIYNWNQLNPEFQLTLAIGVYQFRPGTDACTNESQCRFWTQGQIDVVKIALDKYNANDIPLIDRIVVGNENLETWGIESRLVEDIREIKQFIADRNIKNVTVGTAQTSPTVMHMYNGTEYQSVLSEADFIGVNFYPFWSGVQYGEKGIIAKTALANDWNNLRNSKLWGSKPVIETEEGWPSGGHHNASLVDQHDYFYYWYHGHAINDADLKDREDNLVQNSYFFALNDKLPRQGVESHWGIFSADNSTNILDNISDGGKKLASNLIFPRFLNYIGADLNTNVVYDKQHIHPVIVLACSEDKGKGICYPLYGFHGSGKITNLTIDSNSWDSNKHGFTKFYPGRNQDFMIDKSLTYYKSLLIILDDKKTYPAICWVSSEKLQNLENGSEIRIVWPKDGIPKPCD